MTLTEIAAVGVAITILLTGLLIVSAGVTAPSLTEWLDRPLCWMFGHKPSRYLWPTTYKGKHAEVWRCARGHEPVTYVGGRG